MNWLDLPRKETINKRVNIENIGNNVIRENIGFGINLYHNAISNPSVLAKSLENLLSLNQDGYKWRPARVNNDLKEESARLCFDFKYDSSIYNPENEISVLINQVYEQVKQSVLFCMSDYEQLWNLQMNYYEVYNFVKYGKGEYFKAHVDHGPYNCYTISIVVYLNDDYEGGEIEWNRFGLKIKPTAGSIVIFPSNFIYEHQSHPILDGTKYSVVIMSDYNDLNHKN